MQPETWQAVDDYLTRTIVGEDDVLRGVPAASVAAGLPDIQVTPAQGKLLNVLARSIHAQRILEIGALGGYSTIWLARALQADGRLTSLEINPRFAELAAGHCAAAGVAERVEFIVAPALESLPRLAAERRGPFDLTFIDADKENCPAYFDWAVRLSRPGAMIIVDNVVRGGRVAEADSADPAVRGMRTMLAAIASDPRVSATAVQTVGGKGYDGFLLAITS